MSTQSPWRPAYTRNPDEPLEIHEEMEAPPRRRWPVVAVAIVALLAGIGLGNLTGTSARDLDQATTDLATRTAELRASEAEIDRAVARAEQLREVLSTESRARARAEDGLEAFAREAAALSGHPVSGRDGPGRAGPVLRAWVRSRGAGEYAAARALYADDVLMTVSQNGVPLGELAGVGDVTSAVRQVLPGDVDLTTPTLARGQFAGFGYATQAMTGVTVAQVVDGTITRLWVYVDGRW